MTDTARIAMNAEEVVYLLDKIGDTFADTDITGRTLHLQLLLARDALAEGEWLTQAEACEALHCNVDTLWAGGLVSFHRDGRPRVSRADVNRYAATPV